MQSARIYAKWQPHATAQSACMQICMAQSAAAKPSSSRCLTTRATLFSTRPTSATRLDSTSQHVAGTSSKLRQTVALHVSYVGTAFRGLQLDRALPAEQTVEGVMERALMQSGLIAESNFGDLHRLRWTRSSRTDKGVHSLGTVIGARLLLEPAQLESDPEGGAIASQINAHLPHTVQVLSVQRVPTRFNARRLGAERTYEYLLPAATLVGLSTGAAAGGGGSDGSSATACGGSTGGGEEDARKKLRLFRQALSCFVGVHPFHNYTSRTKSYLQQNQGRRERGPGRSDAAVHARDRDRRRIRGSRFDDDLQGDDGEEEDEEEEEEGEEEEESHREQASGPSTAASTAAGGGSTGTVWHCECSWQPPARGGAREKGTEQGVGVRHYRTVRSFTCGDPQPLTPGGPPCLRLRVTGSSFMLNQIRCMIGAAVAVARGHMSLELLQASLVPHARLLVPRAPPHTLLLLECTFAPFDRKQQAAGNPRPSAAASNPQPSAAAAARATSSQAPAPALAGATLRASSPSPPPPPPPATADGAAARSAAPADRWRGATLRMLAGGQQRQATFRQQVLEPALASLLTHPDWAKFQDGLVHRYTWDARSVQEVTQSFAAWRAEREALLAWVEAR